MLVKTLLNKVENFKSFVYKAVHLEVNRRFLLDWLNEIMIFLTVATMMAASGASAFNHYFDMDIDAVMKRTKRRPIPSGIVNDSKMVLLATSF